MRRRCSGPDAGAPWYEARHTYSAGLSLERSAVEGTTPPVTGTHTGVVVATGGGGVQSLTVSSLACAPLPARLLAVRVTVYLPARLYGCEGVAPVPVVPSPKFHAYDTGASPSTLAENRTSVLMHAALAGVLVIETTLAATGGGVQSLMVSDLVCEPLPAVLLTLSVTVKVPARAYVCEGAAPVPVEPSPKSHAYDTGASPARWPRTGRRYSCTPRRA